MKKIIFLLWIQLVMPMEKYFSFLPYVRSSEKGVISYEIRCPNCKKENSEKKRNELLEKFDFNNCKKMCAENGYRIAEDLVKREGGADSNEQNLTKFVLYGAHSTTGEYADSVPLYYAQKIQYAAFLGVFASCAAIKYAYRYSGFFGIVASVGVMGWMQAIKQSIKHNPIGWNVQYNSNTSQFDFTMPKWWLNDMRAFVDNDCNSFPKYYYGLGLDHQWFQVNELNGGEDRCRRHALYS